MRQNELAGMTTEEATLTCRTKALSVGDSNSGSCVNMKKNKPFYCLIWGIKGTPQCKGREVETKEYSSGPLFDVYKN